MTAVIYARYSSDDQREESIEGQIHECTAYTEKNGMRFTCVMIRFSLPLTIKKEHRPSPLEKRQKPHQREMVRIWIAFLHHKRDSF